MPRRYIPEAMTNYTPVLKPMPVPGIASATEVPLVCVRFSEKLVPYLIGLLEIYRWADRLVGTPEEVDTALGVFQDLIVILTEGNCDMVFDIRQNPDNACQLQKSLDGGQTWSLAFDYSLCNASDSFEQTTLITQGNSYVDNLIRIFNNEPANLDPDAPTANFDSKPGDSQSEIELRQMALCSACKMIVELACETEKHRRSGASGPGGFLSQVGNTIFGFAAIVFASPILGLWAVIFAAANWAFNAISDARLSDTTAIEKTYCCMYNALKGQALSKSTFQNSLDGCNFSGGSAEAQLSGAISYILEQPGMYETFIKSLGIGYREAQLGLLDCPCDPDVCDVLVTFDTGGAPATVTFGSVSNVGEGGTNAARQANVDQDTMKVDIDIPIDCDVTQVQYRYHYSTNRGDNNLTYSVELLGPLDAQIAIVANGLENFGAKNVWATKTVSISGNNVKKVRLSHSFSAGPTAVGHIYIDNIHIT